MSEIIQVDLDEVKELFLFLEDLNHFFHSPTKYSDPETVVAYVEGEMYDKLHQIYYHTVLNWLPESVKKELEDRPSPFEETNGANI